MSEALTTHAPNRLPLTSFFSNDILEVSKYNTQALFLGLTGTSFTTDETITGGHVHDDADSRLKWKQLYSYPLSNNGAGSIGAAPSEAWDALLIDQTSFTRVLACRLFVSLTDAAIIVPRVKVSNDNSAVTTCRLRFEFFEPTDLTTAVVTLNATFSTVTARTRLWIDLTAQDLSALTPDPDWPQRLPIVCLVSAKVDAATEFVALHEIAFGVTP